MKYRKRPDVVDAYQWFKNGDHPDDGRGTVEGLIVRYFRAPDVPGRRECALCAQIMHLHGWIDQPGGGVTVCPGNFVFRNPATPAEWVTMRPAEFARTYTKDHEHTS